MRATAAITMISMSIDLSRLDTYSARGDGSSPVGGSTAPCRGSKVFGHPDSVEGAVRWQKVDIYFCIATFLLAKGSNKK